jgi:hypothetical protein
VSKGIVVFSRAEGVELVAGAEEALHHDGVCGRRAHVVLAKELQQVLVVVPCKPTGFLSGCRQCFGSGSGGNSAILSVSESVSVSISTKCKANLKVLFPTTFKILYNILTIMTQKTM